MATEEGIEGEGEAEGMADGGKETRDVSERGRSGCYRAALVTRVTALSKMLTFKRLLEVVGLQRNRVARSLQPFTEAAPD